MITPAIVKFKIWCFILTGVSLLLVSCGDDKNYGEPLAKVGNKFIYFDDIKPLLPKNLSPEDSLAFIQNYLNKWVRKELMINYADKTLSERQKDLTRQIEEYKNTILLYKCQENIIQKSLDTLVSQTEIDDYFEKNKNNMLLKNSIVKLLFFRVPKNTNGIFQARNWCKSDKQEDLDRLMKFAFKNKGEFVYENNTWHIYKDYISKYPVPANVQDDAYPKVQKNIEFDDEFNKYFVIIKEFKQKGELAPISYVSSDIKNIILNKRKIDLVKEVENRVFTDAVNDKVAEIYLKVAPLKKDTGNTKIDSTKTKL